MRGRIRMFGIMLGILSGIMHSGGALAQIDSIAVGFVPAGIVNNPIYFEKYEPIPVIEVSLLVDSLRQTKQHGDTNFREKDEIYEHLAYFNDYLYRKINEEIEALTLENEKLQMRVVHKRDIEEGATDVYRYVIRSNYNTVSRFLEDEFENVFYIYDRKLNIRYQECPSAEQLIKFLELTEMHMSNKSFTNRNQETLDAYLLRNQPKTSERKPVRLPTGFKIGLGVVAYGIFQWGIIVLSNL